MSEMAAAVNNLEIPPRARRRVRSPSCGQPGKGNTSACAEKSRALVWMRMRWRKYLRVRGEEDYDRLQAARDVEIPPRARRRALRRRTRADERGNTSACAEKSQPPGRT